jgi:hypothetical protein
MYPPSTLIHLSHRFTSDSKPAVYKFFGCCLCHFCTWLGTICHFQSSLREFLDPDVNRFTRQTLPTANKKHLWTSFALSCTQKTHNRTLLFGSTIQVWWPPFWLLKPASEHAHAHLLPILSWSWTVLLPSDTHRIPITSITAVLLSFVTYLLTLPHTSCNHVFT